MRMASSNRLRLWNSSISRRELLKYSGLAAGSVSLAGLLAACGDDDEPMDDTDQEAPSDDTDDDPMDTDDEDSEPEADDERSGGTLIIGMEAEISSLDPAIMTGTSTFRPVSSMFNMLINLHGEDNTIDPDIAESWEVADDATSVTMNLRSGVTFQDGHEVDAETVVYSFERMLNPDHPEYDGPYAFPPFFYPTYETSTAVDPLTVQFDLTQPDATFLSALVWNTASIVSPEAVREMGEDFQEHPVGTGAFKINTWEKNVRVEMDRFDDYYRGKPYLEKLIWVPIVEEAARFNQLASGEVDFIVSLHPQFVPQVEAHPDLQLITSPSLHTWWVYLNMHAEPLDDIRVRQGLNHAIDIDSMIENLLHGTAEPSHGWSWPGTWSYEPDAQQYPYDPDRAMELFAEAGHPDGFTLNYIVPDSGSGMVAPREIATAMQADLQRVGVTVNITTLEWISYIATVAGGLDDINGTQFHLAQMSWMNPVDDPGLYVEYVSAGPPENLGLNLSYYHNDEYAALLAEARVTADQSARADLYKQAQRIFAEDAPWLFMFHSNFVTAARNNVHDIKLNPNQNVLHLNEVWKE
jgi:peptide/nickel transport system substrate-binding protein